MAQRLTQARKWTSGEMAFLKRNYLKVSVSQLCKQLDRSRSSVISKASDLKISRQHNSWTEKEVSFIKRNYSSITAKQMAEKLGRSLRSVVSMLYRLGLHKVNLDWNPREEDVVWLACAIDAEGSIMLQYNGRGLWSARIMICNTSREFVWNALNLSKIGHMTDEINRHGCKPIFRFQLNSNGCRKILPKVLRYLIIKKKQGTLLLEALKLLEDNKRTFKYNRGKFETNTNRLHELRLQIAQLNGGD